MKSGFGVINVYFSIDVMLVSVGDSIDMIVIVVG